MQIPNQLTLKKVYGEAEKSVIRFRRLSQKYAETFGVSTMEFFTAPGRTEIIGNHLDHNGGKVLAASINMDTIGAAYPNESEMIEIVSEGYDGKIVLDLNHLEQIPMNQGTISLIAGMVKAVRTFGYSVSGFQAYISTEVISSAGVSSSASFEMLLCTMINFFFNENKMDIVTFAKIGQYAENHYWSKASGLMDQMACAAGGTILLNFHAGVHFQKIDFNFKQMGYQLVIVNTGRGHADLSREYSEIPEEMKQVANDMGCTRLCETSFENFEKQLPEMIANLQNDRAILRALHFFEENQRVDNIIEAISKMDHTEIVRILAEAGRSSCELLQNGYSIRNDKEQKITLCLALTELFLKKIQAGCCRIHGGGFAGVIMCVLPKQFTGEYVRFMEPYVGKNQIYQMEIRQVGAVHLEK